MKVEFKKVLEDLEENGYKPIQWGRCRWFQNGKVIKSKTYKRKIWVEDMYSDRLPCNKVKYFCTDFNNNIVKSGNI